MSQGPGNGLLEQLAIADRPGGPAMALPLGRHHQSRPTQLVGSAADGGIGATGTSVEQQVHQTAPGAGQQLSGNPLMGPGQITAATGRDHQRASRGNLRPRWTT